MDLNTPQEGHFVGRVCACVFCENKDKDKKLRLWVVARNFFGVVQANHKPPSPQTPIKPSMSMFGL